MDKNAKSKLEEFNVFSKEEVNEFAKYWFDDNNKEKSNIILDRICDRAKL